MPVKRASARPALPDSAGLDYATRLIAIAVWNMRRRVSSFIVGAPCSYLQWQAVYARR